MADSSVDPGRLERLLTRLDGTATLYESSVRAQDDALFALVRTSGTKRLAVLGATPPAFETDTMVDDGDRALFLCPCSPANARRLRSRFPWTAPTPVGRTTALGCGDRLGVATPGHIRACQAAGVVPVLAQQSIREMERTGRSPQEVLDDVTWAVFQEGYTAGYGADADHLKTEADIDACLEAGYTMYTLDPSEHVQNDADRLEGAVLTSRFRALPWDALGTTPAACLERYAGTSVSVGEGDHQRKIEFSPTTCKRAAVKYGAALAHTKALAEHLSAAYRADRPDEGYDLEVSVDETDTPTRPREHYFVAAELNRLGVEVTSLAPRFVGDFEKGVDYRGDLAAFEDAFRAHAAIARSQGGYKLSIHSGSDKFSVYPILGAHAGDHLHLKTAGTSFLEALRIPARHAPDLFREMVEFAFERFEEDRRTYHVTTRLDAIPAPGDVPDPALETTYLEDDDGRQLLHITYGSLLSGDQTPSPFRERLFALLDEHEDEHYEALRSHFLAHIDTVGEMAVH
ncbi:MAG: tagaturonate epimerase family protein [Salinibacter sp.]